MHTHMDAVGNFLEITHHKNSGCGLAYNARWVILLIPYGFGKSEPHQVCMQVNTHYPWVCKLEPTGAPMGVSPQVGNPPNTIWGD